MTDTKHHRGWPAWLLAGVGVVLVGAGFTLPEKQLETLITGTISLFSSWALANRNEQERQQKMVSVSADAVAVSADTVTASAEKVERVANAVLALVGDMSAISAKTATNEQRITAVELGLGNVTASLTGMTNEVTAVKHEVGELKGLVRAALDEVTGDKKHDS